MTDVVDGVAVDTSSVTVTVSQGASGTDGTDGLSVLNGSGAPSSSLGVDGDFYIDTTAHAIYGPKASGAWGSSTSLIGPAGADGTDGTNGTDGADGEGVPVGGTTGQVLAKTSDTDFDTEWVDQTGGTSSVASDDITDATTVGKAVLTASDAATARTAIGAGTSSLALGTTSTTALAGDTAIPDSPDDIGAVPTTRTVNSKALSADITLSASDVSAVPTTRTVNSKALSADITLSASDVSAVPTTRTVAGHALSSDVTIAVGDVSGAAPLASPALTGTPTAPTATAGTNNTQVATTAYVDTAVAAGGGGGGSTTSYSDIFLLMGA